MARCELCGLWFELGWLETHLVEDHGQEPLERWSDGSPVIVDRTLGPEDFADV